VLNGGIISGIIDCHCMCTIIAEYYKNKSTEEKESPKHMFATGSIKVDFLKPTPVNKPIQLRAIIKEMHEKKAVVSCSLYSEGEECARGEVLGVRVPANLQPGK
jgi:acyl-CoA thioesterase FadM